MVCRVMLRGSFYQATRGYEEKNEFIVLEQYPSIGSGNNTGGYSWIDTFQIKAAIIQKGLTALEGEIKKGTDERLKDSLIDVNQSIIDTKSGYSGKL